MTPDKDVTIAARVRPDLKADVEEVRARLGEKDASVIVRRALTEYVDKVLERGQAGPGGLLDDRDVLVGPRTTGILSLVDPAAADALSSAGGALTPEAINRALEAIGATLRVTEGNGVEICYREPGDLGSLNGRPAAHAGDPETSHRAAVAAWPRANTDRHRALELLYAAHPLGMTGDELDVELEAKGSAPYSGRRRLSELKGAGWVKVRRAHGPSAVFENVRRRTRTGAEADVYVLTDKARARFDRAKAAA
jgi:hypothetical protein